MLAHFDTADLLKLSFNRDVDDVMIGDLLINIEDESLGTSRANALSILKLHADVGGEKNRKAYYIDIATVRLFTMVCGFWAKGASFWSASRFFRLPERSLCCAT